ncbi:MAG: Ig-like domain-containing protein [Candidatus Koribacter versatilis]|nr:Ig-like domain-containing protein [Candidatus Koribacter versatilis]
MKKPLILLALVLTGLLAGCGKSSPKLASIQVTPANPSVAAGLTQQFRATGTYSDSTTKDLTSTATWSSSNATVATIAAGGLATSHAQGSSTITASQDGFTGTATLQVTAPVLASVAVTPSNATIPLGTLAQFTATGTLTDGSTQDLTGTATWASSDNTIASIAAGGQATARALGGVTITATSDTTSGSTPLTVAPASLVSLAIPDGDVTIANGTSHQFAAIGIYNDGSRHGLTSQVTWGSSQTSIATISVSGHARALSPGATTITATLNLISASVNLNVTNATIAAIAVAPSSRTIAPLTRLPFTAVGTFSDASTQVLTVDVDWASSNPAAATISNQSGTLGIATGVGSGATTISAAFGGVSGSVPLTVSAATLTSIAVTAATAGLASGSTLPLSARATFSDGTTQGVDTAATWTSSDDTIATVDGSGLVTGLAPGPVTITADLSGVTGSADLTVESVTDLQVSPAALSIAQSTTGQFNATATLSDASTQNVTGSVIWTSSAPAVAIMSSVSGEKGDAVAVAPGVSTITAEIAGLVTTAQLTVTSATLDSIAITPANPDIALGTSQKFKAVGTFSDGTTQNLTGQVSWSSSDVSVAIINEFGVAASAATGTTTISAAFNGVSATTVLTVH